MSSEGSSNKADLGNAFEGDSLGPSSPGGKQTLEFCWIESSQWDLASRQEEVAEGSSKPDGEQGDNETSSSD